ncbi:hypothetical protein ACIU3Q_005306 [Salmonella enterica subsp. enterica serovar Kokomlemle]
MNASPVDFTAAPAADVFPRKAPHPGKRRTRKTGRGKYTRKKPEAPGLVMFFNNQRKNYAGSGDACLSDYVYRARCKRRFTHVYSRVRAMTGKGAVRAFIERYKPVSG